MFRTTLSTLLGLTLAASASASPLMEYNDIDIGYRHTFFDQEALDDGNGLDLNVRFSPVEPLFLEVGYEYLSTGVASVDLDAHALTYGGGAYFGCNEDLHFLGRFGGVTQWIDPEGGETEDETGWYIGPEIRFLAADNVELDAAVTYFDVKDTETWVYTLTSLVALNDSLAVVASLDINDDSDVSLFGGVRVAI